MWKVYLENLVRFGTSGYRMYVARTELDGRFSVITQPVQMKTKEANQGLGLDEAMLDDSRMPHESVRSFLQAMSDAAWEIGIKPKQLEDSSNELKAVRGHLEDMRQLAGVKK